MSKRALEDGHEATVRCRYLKFSNLPHGCTSAEITTLLEPFGKVEEVQVARASGGGMLALVEMSCTREATSAKRRLKDLPLRGSQLTVDFDNSRSESQQQPPLTPAIGSSTAAEAPVASGKLPPFYVPDRMVRDVLDNRVLKMRSVLWTAREDDIRGFFRGLTLDRDAIEMGRDFAGRFSGMVYVRLRSTADLNVALRKQSEYLCGRQVILQRLDPGTPNLFRPEALERMRAREAAERAALDIVEPRVWPTIKPTTKPMAKTDETLKKAEGWVSVNLGVTSTQGSNLPALQSALAAAPVDESLAAVRHFLMNDPRLPSPTRRAINFLSNAAQAPTATCSYDTLIVSGATAADVFADLPGCTDDLRDKMLDDPATSTSPVAPHAFRSPFESAGVLGYTFSEIATVFDTRSSDSVFWPIFATFNTLLPQQVPCSHGVCANM